MPAVEAVVAVERELSAYEFAFHILPTIAEGEVPAVFASLKDHITKAGGQIFAEETPQRFDLAYEIEKYLEGKNRKFASAYFGWVRFRLGGDALTALSEELAAEKSLLRHLLIKLTKVEEANPLNFHESIAHRKVETIAEVDLEELGEAIEKGEGEVEIETEEVSELPPTVDSEAAK